MGRFWAAERVGFEPTIPFWGIHTFQACSFDHSDISPGKLWSKRAQRYGDNPFQQVFDHKFCSTA
jgi:hypothetical protein